MTNEDKAKLFRIVRDRLNCGKVWGKRKHVESAIFDAHNGRPDGLLVTNENMYLFRQYRNGVSPSPAKLVNEALAWKEGGAA
jgi:hypothetical protein